MNVKNIIYSTTLKSLVILCHSFFKKENFFADPFTKSSVLSIFIVSEHSEQFIAVPISEIASKIVLLSFREKHVALPLLHSF